MATTYSINSAVIMRTLDSAVRTNDIPEIRAKVQAQAESAAPIISDTLVGELRDHWVTRELEGSNVGRAASGFPAGNIISYFGLPSSLIRSSYTAFQKLMSQPIQISVRKQPGIARYRISMEYPPLETYNAVSPAPEGYGGSWLERLESGTLQNFEHFLSGLGFTGSRSGGGIQSQHVIKKRMGFTVPAIPYISEIYSKAFGGTQAWANRLLSSIVSRMR